MARKFNIYDYSLVFFLFISILINIPVFRFITIFFFFASGFDLFNQKRIYKKSIQDIDIFVSIPINKDYFKFKLKDYFLITLLIILLFLLVSIFLIKRKPDDYHILSLILIGIWRMIKNYQLNQIEDRVKIFNQGFILPGPKADMIRWNRINEILLNKLKSQIIFKFGDNYGYKLLIDKTVDKNIDEIFDFIERKKEKE